MHASRPISKFMCMSMSSSTLTSIPISATVLIVIFSEY